MTPIERFNALPARQRDEILDKHRQFNTEHLNWWDSTYDEFKIDMDAIGIDVDKMYFSGFSSQGDGACFEGRVYDWPKFLESVGYTCAALTALADAAWSFKVEHRGYYYHENCTSFTSDMVNPNDYYEGALEDFVDKYSPYSTDIQNAAFVAILKGYDYSKLHDEFEEAFKGHMRTLYRSLEAEYDHQTSDESVLEALAANDMLTEIIDELESEHA